MATAVARHHFGGVRNFPWVLPAYPLEDGSSVWAGRTELTGGGWHVTLDVRPDHSQVLADVRHTTNSVVTHVVSLRRFDGEIFTAREAARALEGWQIALSFAAGRWIPLAVPSGLDVTGQRTLGTLGVVEAHRRHQHIDLVGSTERSWSGRDVEALHGRMGR